MNANTALTRRSFMGGLAAAMSYLGWTPGGELFAQAGQGPGRMQRSTEQYDAMAKLSSNENPYGPSETVLKAMTDAFKYANRYGYPDGGVVQAIADHHKVKPENIMLGAGSGEILEVVGHTFLTGRRLVVGAEPSYGSVYQQASGIKKEAFLVPLLKNYMMDIPTIIKVTNRNYRDVGFVYICNPNNPTGLVVPKQEIQQLLDGITGDVPVLIDEAYHHFVDDPNYATAVPYVLEGRPVIIARTFSKIAGLAGMRLGYAIAPKALLDQMRTSSTGSVSAVVKWGAVAALKDTANEAKVKKITAELRNKVTAELTAFGYSVIPSQTNFFMVHVRRDVTAVAEEFRKRNVAVGRKFPPMVEHLRVSIGNAEEMNRFMAAFKEIFPAGKSTSSGSNVG